MTHQGIFDHTMPPWSVDDYSGQYPFAQQPPVAVSNTPTAIFGPLGERPFLTEQVLHNAREQLRLMDTTSTIKAEDIMMAH